MAGADLYSRSGMSMIFGCSSQPSPQLDAASSSAALRRYGCVPILALGCGAPAGSGGPALHDRAPLLSKGC